MPKSKNIRTGLRIRKELFILINMILIAVLLANLPKVVEVLKNIFAAGATYYVSTSGNDSNSGSQTAPFRTISKAVSQVNAGDTVMILTGTYTEKIQIAKSGQPGGEIVIKEAPQSNVVIDGQNTQKDLVYITGSYIRVEGFEVKNSNGTCVNIGGKNSTVKNLLVHDCYGHGIYTDGDSNTIDGNEVFMTNLENKARQMPFGWGSAIKVRIGGTNTTIKNNVVYRNYGEGVAVTRGIGALVSNNIAYDNYSVQIYVDNSKDVVVEKNFVYCNQNTGFERGGSPGSGFAIGEEEYDGWGAQLSNILIRNNIAAYCSRGVIHFNADVPGGGMDKVRILNNTFWGSTKTAVSIAYDADKTRNSIIANNIVQQPGGTVGWVEDRTGLSMYNNFWVGAKPSASQNLDGTGDKYGDPGFVTTPKIGDPTSFRLLSNSAAINAGAVLPEVTDDFEGKLRNSSDSPGFDMGAIEYKGSLVPGPVETVRPTITPTPQRTPAPSISPTSTPIKTASPTPIKTLVPTPVQTQVPLNSATPAPSGSVVSRVVLEPIEDTYVRKTNPNTNHGMERRLKSGDSTGDISYLKYDLSALAGKRIVSAILRVYVVNTSLHDHKVYEVLDISWKENIMTYTNRPSLNQVLATFNPGFRLYMHYNINLGSSLQFKGGRTITLGMTSETDDAFWYTSKNSDRPPRLILQVQ